MSDFRVYENRSTNSESYPFLLDVQSELLESLDTRLVIPLVKSEDVGRHQIRNLNPRIRIRENEYFAMTQQMAAISKAILGEAVEQAEFSKIDVLSSIDFLITGI